MLRWIWSVFPRNKLHIDWHVKEASEKCLYCSNIVPEKNFHTFFYYIQYVNLYHGQNREIILVRQRVDYLMKRRTVLYMTLRLPLWHQCKPCITENVHQTLSCIYTLVTRKELKPSPFRLADTAPFLMPSRLLCMESQVCCFFSLSLSLWTQSFNPPLSVLLWLKMLSFSFSDRDVQYWRKTISNRASEQRQLFQRTLESKWHYFTSSSLSIKIFT